MSGLFAWFAAHYNPVMIFWAWGTIALSLGVIHIAEVLFPAAPNQSYRGVLFNIQAAVLFLLITPMANFLPGQLAATTVQAMGGPWLVFDLPKFVPDGGLARIATLSLFGFLPLLVFDFFFYWFHRLQHASFLWEEHKLHHGDDAVNVTSSFRHHWSEQALQAVFISIPLGLLVKITPVEAGLITMFTGQWGYLVHANVRLPLGPLGCIFVGPQVHRIHHSLLPEHQGRNFAAFFSLWDVVFGTFYRPAFNEFPATGLTDVRPRPPLTGVLFDPFVAWYRRVREFSRATIASSGRSTSEGLR